MTSVVYNVKNIEYKSGKFKDNDYITKTRGVISSKSCATSALSDNQKGIRSQTLTAAKIEGLTE